MLAAQRVVRRRRQLFGRLLVRRLLLLPTPRYRGFHLYRAWRLAPLPDRLRSLLEAGRSIARLGLWHPRPLAPTGSPPAAARRHGVGRRAQRRA